jgi:predicted metal-dependent hydrolase
MGQLSAEITAIVERFQGRELDAHYLAFFECFNQGLFFEAHEVLEKVWLPQRNESNGRFYKGLIQLAGAFVHLQKGRLRPAGALLELARANLEGYGPMHDQLDVKSVLALINSWSDELNEGKSIEYFLKSRGSLVIRLISPK